MRKKRRRDDKMAKGGEDGPALGAKKWRRDAKGAKVAKPGDMHVTVLTIGPLYPWQVALRPAGLTCALV